MDQRPLADLAQVRDGGDTSGGVTGQRSRNDVSSWSMSCWQARSSVRDSRRRLGRRRRRRVWQESSFVGRDQTSTRRVLLSGLDADDPVAFHEDGGSWVAEHGPPAQPVDDNNATTSPSRAPPPLSFRDASSRSVSTA